MVRSIDMNRLCNNSTDKFLANLAQSDAGENGLKIFIQNLPFLEQLSLKMDYGVDLPVDIAANTTHLFGTLLSPSTIVQLF